MGTVHGSQASLVLFLLVLVYYIFPGRIDRYWAPTQTDRGEEVRGSPITHRLREALVSLGLATCGEVASRLAPRLGMQVAPTTLPRRLRAVPVARAERVRVLGVDDFAWKKGQT